MIDEVVIKKYKCRIDDELFDTVEAAREHEKGLEKLVVAKLRSYGHVVITRGTDEVDFHKLSTNIINAIRFVGDPKPYMYYSKLFKERQLMGEYPYVNLTPVILWKINAHGGETDAIMANINAFNSDLKAYLDLYCRDITNVITKDVIATVAASGEPCLVCISDGKNPESFVIYKIGQLFDKACAKIYDMENILEIK